jgi:molecular chaperone DnaJ
MADKDFYSVLGVSRTASEDEIRTAYRKLARKFHPDVNPGNADAEARFKEIAAAYDALSDPEKRKLYDEFGHEGLRGGFDPEQARAYRSWQEGRRATAREEDPGDAYDFDLGDLFGGSARRARPASGFAGEDLHALVELDLAQAIRGAEVSLRLPRRVPCPTCHGTGDEPGTKPETCPECHGTGRRQVVQGPMRLMAACPRCGGTGTVGTPCHTCDGDGFVREEEPLTVRIPPGAEDGSRVVVKGRGEPGVGGGPPGDIVIETRVRPHPFFRRDGLDLELDLPVTLDEAYNGASVEVPTPDGPVKLRVPPRSQQRQRLRIRGKGVLRGGKQGDLYVNLDVRLPEKDDPELRAALEKARADYTKPVREGIRL